MQNTGFKFQQLFDFVDGLAGDFGVGNEQAQIIQLAVAAAECVAHAYSQHVFRFLQNMVVYAGNQHHVAECQRAVYFGRVGLAVTAHGRGIHTLRQPAGNFIQGFVDYIRIFNPNGIHLQRNAFLRRHFGFKPSVV